MWASCRTGVTHLAIVFSRELTSAAKLQSTGYSGGFFILEAYIYCTSKRVDVIQIFISVREMFAPAPENHEQPV
jgi:hypothetical protein